MSERDLLMIPGLINFHPGVLRALSAPTEGHTSPEFIERFGQALEMMKQVWLAPSGTPLAIAGSGTLAMDMAVCNLVEYGDTALVLSTGYFGDRRWRLFDRGNGIATGRVGCGHRADRVAKGGGRSARAGALGRFAARDREI